MLNLSVYLAGPIQGLSYDAATDWRAETGARLAAAGLTPLSPMRYKHYLQGEEKLTNSYEQYKLSSGKGIFARDKMDVQRSGLVLVNLLGAKTVSIGTVMEMSWAHLLHKPVVVVMEPDNIHKHAMLDQTHSLTVDTLPEAESLVIRLLLPERYAHAPVSLSDWP